MESTLDQYESVNLLCSWAENKKQLYRKASKKYYEAHYVIKPGMTPEEIEQVEYNKKIRAEKYQAKKLNK